MQWKAVELLADHILKSGNIGWSIYNNREEVYGQRSHARKEFGDRVVWLAVNMPKGATDCYTCKDNNFRLASL
jgi:hypothetical protein